MAVNYWSQGQQLEKDDESDAQSQQELAKQMDAMLMATQDIFYFDYGCVVFLLFFFRWLSKAE